MFFTKFLKIAGAGAALIYVSSGSIPIFESAPAPAPEEKIK